MIRVDIDCPKPCFRGEMKEKNGFPLGADLDILNSGLDIMSALN